MQNVEFGTMLIPQLAAMLSDSNFNRTLGSTGKRKKLKKNSRYVILDSVSTFVISDTTFAKVARAMDP